MELVTAATAAGPMLLLDDEDVWGDRIEAVVVALLATAAAAAAAAAACCLISASHSRHARIARPLRRRMCG